MRLPPVDVLFPCTNYRAVCCCQMVLAHSNNVGRSSASSDSPQEWFQPECDVISCFEFLFPRLPTVGNMWDVCEWLLNTKRGSPGSCDSRPTFHGSFLKTGGTGWTLIRLQATCVSLSWWDRDHGQCMVPGVECESAMRKHVYERTMWVF